MEYSKNKCIGPNEECNELDKSCSASQDSSGDYEHDEAVYEQVCAAESGVTCVQVIAE